MMIVISLLSKNKAVYTAALVACWWAGAVKQPKKQTDPGWTDIPTKRHVESRSTRLKIS